MITNRLDQTSAIGRKEEDETAGVEVYLPTDPYNLLNY